MDSSIDCIDKEKKEKIYAQRGLHSERSLLILCKREKQMIMHKGFTHQESHL